MYKQEFMEILKDQLTGEMPDAQIGSHLSYYERYIADEAAKGKTEEEVIEILGDPRLIAKTLIATNVKAGPKMDDTMGDGMEEKIPATSALHWLDLSTWYGKMLAILIAIVIIVSVVTILSALLPIIIPCIVVGIIIIILKRRRQ